MGVRSIYPWQFFCLLGKRVLAGEQNLVYTARQVEQPAKKAILVLPYVALVQENLKWLQRVVEGVIKQINTKGHPILNGTFPQCKRT